MKRKYVGKILGTHLLRNLCILGLLFAFLLTGCASNTQAEENSDSTEHVHNWDYSCAGEFHATKTTELESVASEGIAQVYATWYKRPAGNFTEGANYYIVYDKSLQEQKLSAYKGITFVEYITEGTPRWEEGQVVHAYCAECDKYWYEYNSYSIYTYNKLYIPEGTLLVILVERGI